MNSDGIRTVQFIDSYFPTVDGVVQTVHNYASILNKSGKTAVVFPTQRSDDFDYDSLGYDAVKVKKIHFSVTEYSVPKPHFDKELKNYLDSFNADIFHVHSPFFIGSYAVSYAKKHNIPCITTFHSKYYDDALHITGSKLIAETLKKRIVKLYNNADSVWACSNGTAATLKEYGYKGDIFVMDNGSAFDIDDLRKEQLKKRAASEFGLTSGKRRLLFVGHLIWHKNLKLVLDTFKKLCEESDDYSLLIVGNGYDEEQIKKYADGLHFNEGALKFAGRITDRELLAGVILNSDLFFFPSVYDNAPLVVREAASLCVPSLLTEGSNAADVIKKDVNGFTAAENADAMYSEIKRIFSDGALLNDAGINAKKTVAKKWEDILSSVKEKYLELISEYKAKHKSN